ncbi:non-canonical purine NTP diphosphatase [Parabacteroides sp. Marseille-P3160]|uniref:non-canonical purine NTP diphosphatase n=1 Tax=Parabacteroides sp. Marseille-P3160 TaxID=1917887 RepID=UPI0009BB3276|nr:non-canonical purine NTP diphosphatase [Parabacteroides sp. Marseille-P3160]
MRTIVFATNNAHKLEEAKALLGQHVQLASLKDIHCLEEIPETAETLVGNALQKAYYVKRHYGKDCFADDTGLEVEALDYAPGVYSARYAGPAHDSEANMQKLLRELEGESNRKARFHTIIALLLEGREYLFEGIINGHITEKRWGTAGFGYDPIFVPEGYDQTFAEMGNESKNKISHRALAIRKMGEFLSKISV